MTKVYCGRYSCQYCFGEVCGKGTVKITSNGCDSYKCVGGWKDPNIKSDNPWNNYETHLLKMRLMRENKISKDAVN